MVWTDTIQTIVMYAAMIIIIAMGVINIGGFDETWKRNRNSGRIDFFKYII